jgi:hypothetical protein
MIQAPGASVSTKMSRRSALLCLGLGAIGLPVFYSLRRTPEAVDVEDIEALQGTSLIPIPDATVLLSGTAESGARNGFVFQGLGILDVPEDGELRILTEVDTTHVPPGNIAGIALRPYPPVSPNLELVWSRRVPPGGNTAGPYIGHHGLGQPAEYQYFRDTGPIVTFDVRVRGDHATFRHDGVEKALVLRSSLIAAQSGRLQLRAYVQGGPNVQLGIRSVQYDGAQLTV